MAEDARATRPQSMLFRSEDRTVILIDVPRSIEEAQELPSRFATECADVKRLVSSKPIETPFKTPEPKHGNGGLADSVYDLMSAAAATHALEVLRNSYYGSYCLPRIVSPVEPKGVAESQKRKRENSADGDDRGRPAEAVIPENSFHLHGTIISERDRFLEGAPTFDLIVLDPPWPNRSARRKKNSYKIADHLDELKDTLSLVPIAAHLSPDGLVAVWVTNKASVVDLMTGPNGKFAEWGLEMVDEWTWLKVTTSGETIVDINSRWRKPWERILIARRRGSKTMLPSRGRVLVSVPDMHSRKPNLRDLFEDVLTPGYMGLEIFARNLTAGWWSWGDEVLKFQQPEHWVEP